MKCPENNMDIASHRLASPRLTSIPKLHFSFYKRCTLALLMFAVFNILVGQFTNVDLMVEDYYFDTDTQRFIWKHTWFAKDFMHGYVKHSITAIGAVLFLVVMLDLFFSHYNSRRIISPWLRIRLRFVAIALLIIATSVAVFKHFSVLHCPWSVDRYGGSAPFVRLFDFVPSTLQAGHCFPAGHATVALWLSALCVFWLPHQPKTAFAVFLSGLSVGFALGWVQQMRGAHFLSHTLWATWFAALVVVVMLSLTKQLND